LHIGVTPWRVGVDRPALSTQARSAERSGYDSLFLPESHFVERHVSPDPLIELAAVAGVTERLRLGTTSYLLTIRHPLLVAEQVALLDQLSGGRLILGLGRGFRRSTFVAFGVSRETKRERLAESLDLVLRAWRGERVTVRGGDEGEAVEVFPRPLQQPHPPLWMAAFGPRALTQAGDLALPYLASPLESMERLEANYRLHREAWKGAEGAAADVVPVMRTVHLARDRGQLERVRSELERERGALRARRPPLGALSETPVEQWALIGERALLGERLAELRERLGLTHLVVRPVTIGLDPEEVERSVRELPEVLCAAEG
jgi:alkanesulfonate monooxygenase SsuD/methylene tetrahydromethanopterin reductase-like flavin-dependent oxidoreductase (luciferase family)